MLDTFREYLGQFRWEMYDLFEMARLGAGTIPTFDEDDQKYYKYIIDNAPDKIKEDPDLLRSLVQQALFLRYGSEAKGGVLHDPELLDKNAIDHTFNLLKGGRIKIDNIPMNTRQLADKVDAAGYNYSHPDFGYTNSMWGPFKEELVPQIIRWASKGIMPEDKWLGFKPKFAAVRKDASPEAAQRHGIAKEKGVSKREKNKSTEKYPEKSMQAMTLDDEDKKFLDSIAERFKEVYGTHLGMVKTKKEMPLLPGMGEDDPNFVKPEDMAVKIRKAQENALTVRYSDHYIDQKDKPNGKFYVKGEFTDNGHIDGQMTGSILFHMGTKPTKLDRVYLNLPQLVHKFEAVKKIRNFVVEPMYRKGMDVDERQINITAAKRMLHRLFGGKEEHFAPHVAAGYHARWATPGQEIIRDPAFFKQIMEDHEAWRNNDGKPVVNPPKIEDPDLAAKCTWRKQFVGKEVITQPLIEDENLNRDIIKMDLAKVIEDDAKRAFPRAVKQLARTAFAKDMGFEEWAKQSANKEDWIQAAWDAILNDKTGVDYEGYRKASQRIQWGQTTIEYIIDKTYKGRGKGIEKDVDEKQSQDPADKEGGLTSKGGGGGGDFTLRGEEEPANLNIRPQEPKVSVDRDELEGEIEKRQKPQLAMPTPSPEEWRKIANILGVPGYRAQQTWATMDINQKKQILSKVRG